MEKASVSKFGVPYLHFGCGEPLLLIHGLGEIKEGWYKQFEFADQYELIIPDLRGHGESTYREGISIHNFAIDLINLLEELQIESAHIVGFSMGGAVAQEIYRQNPSIVRSLILVSTFHYFPKMLKSILYKNRRAKFKKVISTGNPTEYLSHIALYSWKNENITAFQHFFRPKDQIFLKSLECCLNVNNLSLLPKINVPTLVIGAQYDSVLPVWIQLWMHKMIPKSQFVIIKNSGHIAKLEATERFNFLLRNFLNQQRMA